MANEMTLFDTPTQVPAYLQTSEVAKALAAQTEGGLSGGMAINRISLRGQKFRFNKEGVEVGISRAEFLDVVVVAANPHVARTFYLKKYSDDQPGTRPDCYSQDGRTPEADSPALQSQTCALCPQNVKGSAVQGDSKGKACGYGKRIIVTADNDIMGDAFAIDVKAQGLFGDDTPAQRQFNLKSYIEALKNNGLIVPAVVTRISFDDKSSVSKLFFTPVRPLTAQEWAQVEARVNDPAIRKMLDDIDNKAEEGKPVGQPVALAAPAAPAVAAAPKPRGRPAKTETAPAAAPAPQVAPAGGFGLAPAASAAAPAPAPLGFGMTAVAPAAAVQQATAPAVAATGFAVDLEDFDA